MSGARARAGTFAGAWSHRRWRWLMSGFAVSVVGDYLYSIALVVFLIDRTGSAGWVSAAVIGRLLPYALLSAPAGLLADRVDRRRLMVGLDLARAVIMAMLAVLAWLDGPALGAVVLAVMSSVVSTAHRPAAVAATPVLVSEDDLAAANAAEAVIAQAAWFAGPAVGALIVTVSDPGTAFIVNAATFLVSASLVSQIGNVSGGNVGVAREETEPQHDSERETLRTGISEGIMAVRADPGLAALIGFVSALLFAFGMEQVLHVLVAVDRLGLDAEWVGVMGAAIGAGGLLVAPFTARIGRSASVGPLLVVTGIGVGVPMIALAVTTSRTVVVAVLVFEGAAVIVNEMLLVTLLQRACPEGMLARVFGLQESVSSLAQLLGAVIAPVLVAGAGLGVGLWVGGGVSVVFSVLLAPALLALAARLEQNRRAVAPIVERLRRTAIFSEASEASLERLARAATLVAIPAGEVVIQQGETPENLYLIESGDLVVTHRDRSQVREVNRMGPDDWFGEIGLVRDVPRTATVRAESECELLTIPGGVFLEALAGPDVLPDPVRRTMQVRLSRTHGGEDPNHGTIN